jgi:hypothetical protein
VLASHADAILAVVRQGVVTRPIVREFRRLLEAAPSTKLGFVMVGAEPEKSDDRYDGYYVVAQKRDRDTAKREPDTTVHKPV